jgi:hypothetical protein
VRRADDALADACEIERLERSGIGKGWSGREQLQEPSFFFNSSFTSAGSAFPREFFMI